MAIPERITPHHLADYLEVMSMAIFQAGIRWAMIDAKWPDFKKAFKGFDPQVVALFTAADIDRLASDPRLVRSKNKVEAVVLNARRMVDLNNMHGSFGNYLHSFETYDQLAADVKRNFKFMGDLNVYYFLFRVGEQVPPFEDWLETIPGDHPRMKEMIDLARRQDRNLSA
jgi:hypothetical protein